MNLIPATRSQRFMLWMCFILLGTAAIAVAVKLDEQDRETIRKSAEVTKRSAIYHQQQEVKRWEVSSQTLVQLTESLVLQPRTRGALLELANAPRFASSLIGEGAVHPREALSLT
jgi:hypothetical protein